MTTATRTAPSPTGTMVGPVVTSALDLTVVVASACVAMASIGAGDILGRRWIALFFVLFGPGWAVQRFLGRTASADTAFVAIGSSIAAIVLLGHLTITTLAWHWAPVLVFASVATIAGVSRPWLLDRTTPTDVRPGAAPTGSSSTTPASSSEHWLSGGWWFAAVCAGLLGGLVAVLGLRGANPSAIDASGLFPAFPIITWVDQR